ncbi:hypothetical protein [Shewanella maritima]|uniref:hypothetical protein n=1 Tax=Shewanella maritima TaxID=2520507 RepID=UPI0037368942
MVRLLLAMCLFPVTVFANPTVQTLLAQGDFFAPITVMQELESKNDRGTICGFGMDVADKQLVYRLSMIDLSTGKILRFQYLAADGSLLQQSDELLTNQGVEQVNAVKMLQGKNIHFSDLVAMARKNHQGQLLQAELDHDLSISYLELKLLNQNSKSIVAFDIKNLRPLPLLKWD